MDDRQYVHATAALIAAYFLASVVSRRFDPFAPVWLFLVGYIQVYVLQAYSYREWAISVRGVDLVTTANQRALWALAWFLAVYHLGGGRLVARRLPTPPRKWSNLAVGLLSPVLIVWGLYCTGILGGGSASGELGSPEDALLRSFPYVLMVGAVMLIVTGRRISAPQPIYLAAGLFFAFSYMAIWMFNGKRSPALIGVLATVCAYYSTHMKRPSWGVLTATAFVGALVVAVAIGWRIDVTHDRSFIGFIEFMGDFDVSKILDSLDITDTAEQTSYEIISYETKEYGGYLLMLDTVPMKSDYDGGANYLRMFSTFIPRILWPTKPLYGRKQWVDAWIAGSELERDEDFTSPAIGILGATQLNGGAPATVLVLAVLALLLRSSYEYFRLHADSPWVQFFWSITFFNAWFMIVGDDPMTWFYFNWSFASLPAIVILWFVNKGPDVAWSPSAATTAAAG
ncbi:hypothetical protein [Paludisphaera borealis]|uniref:Oligosaccharide repeat unit polymerase n=1 Tax=Paludisphaera borealis TaxID=1387353 RepID=A0A1U7CRZ9_9BACT|nr:hypothetical protein [Paludisphaera borealis]APW61669.1 hypothetical protein BSF38_03194 [Paludisphaera borealis]